MNVTSFSHGRTLALIVAGFLLHGAVLGQSLSRANRIFIERGLQQQGWMPDGATGDLSPQPPPQVWQQSNSTTATFYQQFTSAPFLPFSQSFLDANPNTQWGIAQAPDGHLSPTTLPTTEQQQSGILDATQLQYLPRLTSIQFGDEETYSAAQVAAFKAWFALSKQFYPNVLVSSNQYSGEFGNNLASYVQTAQPDLITFDHYYFDGTENGNYNGLYQDLQSYRLVSMQGYDGTGSTQVPFGYYLQGYKLDDVYIQSESETNLNSFAAWTMGAKWTSLFRWRNDNGNYYIFWLPGGALSPQYYQFAAVQAAGNKLGPYLVRMNTSGVAFVPGSANSSPSNIPVWKPDSTVSDISVTNVGGAGCSTPPAGLQSCSYIGSVLLGYFTPIPNLGSDLSGHGLPAGAEQFFVTPGTKGFMVLNGLVASNTNPSDPNSTGGTGSETSQSITISLTAAESADSVWRVDRLTGAYEPVDTTLDQNGNRQFTTVLPGGTADLFFVTPSVTNVTNSVSITSSGLTYNRITKTGTETVTVTNTTGVTINGPLELELAPGNPSVSASNAGGTYQGNSYWTSGGSLAPGASATFIVSFSYPLGTTFTTTPTLYSGGI